MPLGNFFKYSEANFGIQNPFPRFNFAMAVLWLIPALAAITLLTALSNKKASFAQALAGILTLGLTTMYILFTIKVSSDWGSGYSIHIGIYLAIAAAAGIILITANRWLKKIIWVLLGPIIAYIGFYEVSKYLENQKFDDTANTSAVHTVNAIDLIREFHTNDSLANAKYREKILTVNGNISKLETPNDSTVNVKFIDSTGSYAIFTFHDQDLAEAKKLKEGDKVSVKGSCSGGVLSEILGIESITFKRCTINK